MNNDELADIQAARRGDPAAFTRLVEAYQGPVYNLAYRMLGDGAEAEEAAQETFLRMYTQFATYQPGRKFSTWVLSIASHYCIDRLRKRRLTWLSIENEEAPEEAMPSAESGPEDSVIQDENEAVVKKMLSALPPDYRLPVTLRYWYDLSYEEIAEATHSTVSAVKSKLFRARAMLAGQVERMGAAANGVR